MSQTILGKVTYRYEAETRHEIESKVELVDGKEVVMERIRFNDSWYYGEQPWGPWEVVPPSTP